MKLSQDEEEMKSWVPLMIEGRKSDEPIALTYDETGTDVNFGALTAKLFNNLEQSGVDIQYKQNVLDIKQQTTGAWLVKVKDLVNNETKLMKLILYLLVLVARVCHYYKNRN